MREFQGNKLFKESDEVHFDPIFNRIRSERPANKKSCKYIKGISAIKKSLSKNKK